MTDVQELFLFQSRSVLRVFNLCKDESLPPCHALHHLQMATELLGKAYAWGKGPQMKLTHSAFLKFLKPESKLQPDGIR